MATCRSRRPLHGLLAHGWQLLMTAHIRAAGHTTIIRKIQTPILQVPFSMKLMMILEGVLSTSVICVDEIDETNEASHQGEATRKNTRTTETKTRKYNGRVLFHRLTV